MEREPQLETRAQMIVDCAHEALSLPDKVHLLQRYSGHIGGDYFLEVRSTSDTQISEFLEGNCRYIYLYESRDPKHFRTAFSLNLNALTGKGEVRGLVKSSSLISEAIERTEPIRVDERDLLTLLLEVLRQYEASMQVDTTKIEALEESFRALINRGAVVTTKQVLRFHDDGTEVMARSQQIEGSLQHVSPIDLEEPSVRITVSRKTERNHTVLEQAHDGRIEAFEEIADDLERMAAYSKDEEVVRDEAGQIISVVGTHHDDQVIIAAERAMGVRALHPEQIELIERYVNETLIA